MKYIHNCLSMFGVEKNNIKILDVGAGTGRYSVALAEEGYDVTAVELVKHNLGRLKQKSSLVKAYQGNAMQLSRFSDNTFDLTLLFGPLYHLKSKEEKVQALREAKRVTKEGGYVLAAYIMNEYSIITYAFKEGHILEAIQEGMVDASFHCTEKGNPLYSMVRLEDVEELNRTAGLKREKLISPDGAANYIRQSLHALSEEEFKYFIDYQMAVCERADLMGAAGHIVDILRKSV